MAESRLRTLILALIYPHRASYYDDWRDAFVESPLFDCTIANILRMQPADLAAMTEQYDSIIMLHSCNSDTLDYLRPIAPVLGDRRRAKLVSFVGNEFNSPYVSMQERTALLGRARCDIVATQLLEEAGTYLYASSGAQVVSMPHALNPAAFKPGPPQRERKLDIGLRGYRYPPYLGDDDRNALLARFIESADRWGLAVDIGEDKRLNREDWASFLQASKGTISTETGSWYIAPDDELITRIHRYLSENRRGLVIGNDSAVRRAARHLPMPVKAFLWRLLAKGPVKFEVLDDYATPFAELNEHFFRHEPRAPVYGKAISSRHFDAIGTKTCQVLLEGRYNDLLVAGEHYLPVRADLSNLEEVVAEFADPDLRQRTVDAAYDHVMGAHTYRHRAEALHAAILAA